MKIYLAGDVSKGYADWTVLTEKKTVLVENFQLDDTFDGHSKLYEVLENLHTKYDISQIFAAVESTGGYENNWFNTLKQFQNVFNMSVARINPSGVCFNRLASMRRNVTDAISALSIAEFMINHPENIPYDEEEYWKGLRRHWNFIEMQKKQRTQTINQLETIIYCANPMLMRYKIESFPNWLLELIIRCPTSEMLAKADAEELSKIPYLSKPKAELLILEAQDSIASATDKNSQMLVKQIALQIKMFNDTIKAQEQLIENEFSCTETELLKSFKGIGTVSAIGLLLEIGTVVRFPTVKALCSYFWVHPKFKMSGDKLVGVKMSKQGSPNMRKILFNIVKGAINYNTHIKDIYEGKVAEGKSKMSALGICMHKVLRIVYGILKNKKEYDPQVDKRNKEYSKEKEQTKVLMETANIQNGRRVQEFDSKAPISRKQTKKRVEHVQTLLEVKAKKEQKEVDPKSENKEEHALSQCDITTQSAGSTCSSKN
jgi:transposase